MRPHFERGRILYRLRRHREAVEEFRKDLADHPDSAWTHASIAASLIYLRDLGAAREAVHQAIAANPELAYAHYILSFVERNCGRFVSAENAVLEAIRLHPTAPAYLQLARILGDQRRLSDSLSATDAALRLAPTDVDCILLRGELFRRLGRLDEARVMIRLALANEPEHARAQHKMGSLSLLDGESEMALDMFYEARRIDPNSGNDPISIATAYGRLLWPFRNLSPVLIRWWNWPSNRRWTGLLVLGAAIVLGGAGVEALGTDGSFAHVWPIMCVLMANFLAMPFSLDRVAAVVAILMARTKTGLPWSALSDAPALLLSAVGVHVLATVVGWLVSAAPGLGIIACSMACCVPLITESFQDFQRLTLAFLTRAIVALIAAAAALFGAIRVSEGRMPSGLAILLACTAFTFFDDDIRNWLNVKTREAVMKNDKRSW